MYADLVEAAKTTSILDDVPNPDAYYCPNDGATLKNAPALTGIDEAGNALGPVMWCAECDRYWGRRGEDTVPAVSVVEV